MEPKRQQLNTGLKLFTKQKPKKQTYNSSLSVNKKRPYPHHQQPLGCSEQFFSLIETICKLQSILTITKRNQTQDNYQNLSD